MLVARRFLISGRVQGVGFRFFVEDRATAEGLHGWVRNLPDGRVEALFEGDAASVDRVEAVLWRGPSGSVVDNVASEAVAPSGRATGFSIR
jgi:acylphosphatase